MRTFLIVLFLMTATAEAHTTGPQDTKCYNEIAADKIIEREGLIGYERATEDFKKIKSNTRKVILLGLCKHHGDYIYRGILVDRWFRGTNHAIDAKRGF